MMKAGEQTYVGPSADGGLGYLIYAPPDYDASTNRRWPVVCFLHGIGEAEKGFDDSHQGRGALLKHGAPPWHCQINSPLVRDFIIFSPQLPDRRRWNEADLAFIVTHIAELHAQFNGDPARTFLTGFSIGGKATLDFAAGAGGIRWAALWPVDDAATEPRDTCQAERIWLHFGSWRPDVQQQTSANLGLQSTEPFVVAEPPSPRCFTSYAGYDYDHCATCVAAYSDWRAWRWLLGGN
jgi:predicted peptidase